MALVSHTPPVGAPPPAPTPSRVAAEVRAASSGDSGPVEGLEASAGALFDAAQFVSQDFSRREDRNDAEPRRRPFADLDGSGIGATHAGAEQLTDRKTYAALLAATERGAEGLSTQRGGSRSSGGGFASLLSQAAEIYEETARIIYGQPVPRGQSYSAIL